jgi:hypothetical protein
MKILFLIPRTLFYDNVICGSCSLVSRNAA